jgi:hypothetical protein
MLALLLAAAAAAGDMAAAGDSGRSQNVGTKVPAPPTALKCAKSTGSSVTLEWTASPGSIHLYDLEAGGTATEAEAMPFTSVTVTGTSATIDELKSSTDYFFKVRAHCAASGFEGCTGGKEQMIAGWSNFSSIVPCTTATAATKSSAATRSPPAAAAALPSSAEQPLVDTMWLEVYRVTENMKTSPDYLANHNTGDLKGDVAFLTNSGGTMTPGHSDSHFFDFVTSPRVRYCVEVQRVDLSDVSRTSSYPPFIPINQSFSDYLSCNGAGRGGAPGNGDPLGWKNYSCACDNHIDRTFSHQTDEQLSKFCPSKGGGHSYGPGGGTCNCSEASLAASAKHVGFMPMVLPIDMHFGPSPPPPPGPPPTEYGGWYHFPAATKCPDDGTPVGTDGCTWRRDPRAHMLYGKDLVAAGWNTSIGGFGNPVPSSAVEANTKVVEKAMGALTTRCCGCS